MNDKFYMQLAIDLAKNTKGQTAPNPTVGSVVVKDGRIIGMGAHLKAGEPHAEIQALNMAGSLAEGSTIYVTLEPCSHFGKTPPCANRIVEEKVKRVVVAALDPNPLVSGKGIEIIKKAGIEVTIGILEKEVFKLNEGFNKYITSRLPFVTVKTAMTLDGKIATHTGNSRWITGEKSRENVHWLRHEHDAIMVGIGTVLKDDPALTVRTEQQGLNPIRIIIDSYLKIPIKAKVINDKQAETWIFAIKMANKEKIKELEKLNVKVIITSGETNVSMKEVLKYLGEQQITSVLVEAGSSIVGTLLDEELIDKYICFIAPKLIGGKNSPTSIGGEGIDLMSNAVTLSNLTFEQYGDDLCIIGYPLYKK